MGIICICPACKSEFTFNGGKKHFERTKKHYCSKRCQNVKHGLARKEYRSNKTNTRYQMWSHAKKRSRVSGILFNINPEDVPDIPNICPVLGIDLVRNINKNGPSDSSPSLDRVDTNAGYVIDNIRIISNRANRIKSDATFEEIEKIYLDLKYMKHAKYKIDGKGSTL